MKNKFLNDVHVLMFDLSTIKWPTHNFWQNKMEKK